MLQGEMSELAGPRELDSVPVRGKHNPPPRGDRGLRHVQQAEIALLEQEQATYLIKPFQLCQLQRALEDLGPQAP